jgi:hypothetical protein
VACYAPQLGPVSGPHFFAAKYANPSLAEDVKMVIGLLQLPVTAIIVAISVEDSAAMKAGTFLQDEKKGEGAS